MQSDYPMFSRNFIKAWIQDSGSFFAKASDFMVVNNELLFSTDPIGESGGENQDHLMLSL